MKARKNHRTRHRICLPEKAGAMLQKATGKDSTEAGDGDARSALSCRSEALEAKPDWKEATISCFSLLTKQLIHSGDM